MDISIVIPAFNEEKKIAKDILAAEEFLMKQKLSGEIIIVDDGSSDQTTKVAEGTLVSPRVQKRVVRYQDNRGKGYAVRRGIGEAIGNVIMFIDSGLCFNYTQVEEGYLMIKTSACDIAHGSRWLPQSRVIIHQPGLRRLASKIFRWVVFSSLRIPPQLTDTQCGLKLYKNKVAKEIFAQAVTDGYAFDIEVMLRAIKRGYVIKEFPVECHHDHDSRLPTIKASWRILGEVFSIKRLVAREW